MAKNYYKLNDETYRSGSSHQSSKQGDLSEPMRHKTIVTKRGGEISPLKEENEERRATFAAIQERIANSKATFETAENDQSEEI